MREAEESLGPSNYRAVVSKAKGKSGSLCLHMGAGKPTLIFVSSSAAVREFKKGNQPEISWDHVGPHVGSKGQELSEHLCAYSER